MQKRNLNKNILQLLKSHSHMDKPPKNTPVEHPPPVAPVEHPPPGEHFWGTAPVC